MASQPIDGATIFSLLADEDNNEGHESQVRNEKKREQHVLQAWQNPPSEIGMCDCHWVLKSSIELQREKLSLLKKVHSRLCIGRIMRLSNSCLEMACVHPWVLQIWFHVMIMELEDNSYLEMACVHPWVLQIWFHVMIMELEDNYFSKRMILQTP